MEILEMIQEWEKGCSNASHEHPEECPECTVALIRAIKDRAHIEKAIKELNGKEFRKYNAHYTITNIYINTERELVIVGTNECDDSDENAIFIKLDYLPYNCSSKLIFDTFYEEF